MIEVRGLSKFYGDSAAIKNIEFDIEEGEIVGLLGLNGAGKSTILKILGCFLLPSGGTARVGGFAVEDDPNEIRRIIGYLPDSPPLYNEMTVTKYLSYVARLNDIAKADVERCVEDAVQRTSLQTVVDVHLSELSHGFRQRVGIAQAIVHKPKVIILDEPINGLDPVQIVEMRDLINSLRKHHTVLLSSHILSEITRTCDRMLVVDNGQLVAQGSQNLLSETIAGQMKVRCLVQSLPDGLESHLSAIHGVLGVKVHRDSQGPELSIETKDDVRAEVAKAIVASGAGLLQMEREEGGLEQIFMQLIRNSNVETAN